jgi:ArsR family transcriptional regulator
MNRPLNEIKADLFKALAHPGRVRVLEVLSTGPHTVGELQPLVGVESSHLSHQLSVLRSAGLVVTRKEGTSVIYSLRDELVAELLAVARKLLVSTLTEKRDLLDELTAELSTR